MSPSPLALTMDRNAKRRAVLDRGLGYIAQTMDQGMLATVSIVASGTIYVGAVPLLAGDVVSNLTVSMTVNGATLTLAKVGLYDSAGNRLAASADNSAAFTSGAPKIVTTALSVPYTVPSDGVYLAALIVVGTTGPTLARGNGSFDAVKLGTNPFPFGRQAGQTDLIAGPLTLTGSGPALWVGLS